MQSRHRSILSLSGFVFLLVLVTCRHAEERAPSADPASGSHAGGVPTTADRTAAPAPPDAAAPASAPPAPTHPAPAPSAPTTIGAAIDEVTYEVTGGFAGFQLELRIRKGGEALVYDAGKLARRGQLNAREWVELVELIDAARLPELVGEHGRDDGSVSDSMRQVVSVRSAGETVTVATDGGPGSELPAGFTALTRRLMELALTLPAST
jgi:hypothetical protein